MRIFAGLAVAALVLPLSSTRAQGAAIFDALLIYQNTLGQDVQQDIPIQQGSDGIYRVTNWNWQCPALQCGIDGFQIRNFSVTLDPDPEISFGGSVTDIGAPSSFAFVFMQPILATQAPGVATASLQGGTTNGGGAAGPVTVTPNAPPGFIPQDGPDQASLPDEIMVYTVSTDGGTTWQNAALDLGPAFTSDPSKVSDNYGPFNPGPVAGPAGSGFFYDAMRVDVNFMLSGGSDVFVFSGKATIIPEPATAAQVVLGLLGLAAAGRRRRR